MNVFLKEEDSFKIVLEIQLVHLFEYSVVSKALYLLFIQIPIVFHCHPILGHWKKVNIGKALVALSERLLSIFSFEVTFLIKD